MFFLFTINCKKSSKNIKLTKDSNKIKTNKDSDRLQVTNLKNLN